MTRAGRGSGGDVVVLPGTAVPYPAPRSADGVADYVAKYRETIRRIVLTSRMIAERYSLTARITLAQLR